MGGSRDEMESLTIGLWLSARRALKESRGSAPVQRSGTMDEDDKSPASD